MTSSFRHANLSSRIVMISKLAIVSVVTLAVMGGGYPPVTPPSNTITADETRASLAIPAGETLTLMNNAKLTVTGDAVIEGTLTAPQGLLELPQTVDVLFADSTTLVRIRIVTPSSSFVTFITICLLDP